MDGSAPHGCARRCRCSLVRGARRSRHLHHRRLSSSSGAGTTGWRRRPASPASAVVGRPLLRPLPGAGRPRRRRLLPRRARRRSADSLRALPQFLLPITRNFHGAGFTEMAQSARIAPLRDGAARDRHDHADRGRHRAGDRRARAAQPDRRVRAGAAAGRGSVAAEGRVPGDAVARDPDAAQRGARLDAHPAHAALGAIARARARGDRAQRDLADAAGRGSARHGADHQRQAAARRSSRSRWSRSRRPRSTSSRPAPPPSSWRSRSRSTTTCRAVSGDSERLQQVIWNLLVERGEVHRARRARSGWRSRGSARTSA